MKADRAKLQRQATEIMRIAEESGVQSNYLFATTFQRYQVQLQILDKLEEAMGQEGMLVSKEYVKGRKNLYSNPAVSERCSSPGMKESLRNIPPSPSI